MESQERIKRLLNYKNLLYQLQALGLLKVFSDNIADALDVSSSLVRKDFAIFGISGSQKGGYEIQSILNKIDQVLGKHDVEKVILVGVGRIGEALLQYEKGFSEEGIKIVAAFDLDPEKQNEQLSIPLLSTKDLAQYVEENGVRFAILAVPENAARQMIETLKAANIKGILNFTSLKLKNSDETIIANVNIEHELARLIYFVNHKQ